MKLIAGLVVAIVILGIATFFLMKSPSDSSNVDPTTDPILALAPAPAPSPITESVKPIVGADMSGKCINPPLNTICVQ
jgi:hypothetical protein